jgi:predicted dehydrogenase
MTTNCFCRRRCSGPRASSAEGGHDETRHLTPSVDEAAGVVPFAAVHGSAANSAVTVGLIGSGSRGSYVAGLLARNTRAHFIKSEGEWTGAPSPRPGTEHEKIRAWGRWQELSGDLIVENNVHSIDVLNWFLGGRPRSAIGSGGSTLPKRGDMRDHNFVAFEYDKGVQGQLSGATLAHFRIPSCGRAVLRGLGDGRDLRDHWRHVRSNQPDVFEKSPREITIDAVSEFVARIAEGRPENVAVRGAESTLTAILGRMAMEARREVTWDEMMKG